MTKVLFKHLVEEKDVSITRGKGNPNANLHTPSFDGWSPVEVLGGSGGVTDGNKGNITVTDSGTEWNININAVDNTKLADMPAWTVKVRNADTTGDPSDANVIAITTATPVAGDFALGFLSTGQIRKFDVSSFGSGESTDIIYQQTFGDSSIQILGSAGITISYSGGHLTVTVPVDKSLKRMSVLLDPAQMVYTDGNFIAQNGFMVTVDISAGGNVPLAASPQVFKKVFTGAVSASNPMQALNPMDTNMMIFQYSAGVVEYAWNDLQANLPNGGLITF